MLVVLLESLVGVGKVKDEEGGRLMSLLVLAFKGVLKGDLKGWERVWEALSVRRRFDG